MLFTFAYEAAGATGTRLSLRPHFSEGPCLAKARAIRAARTATLALFFSTVDMARNDHCVGYLTVTDAISTHAIVSRLTRYFLSSSRSGRGAGGRAAGGAIRGGCSRAAGGRGGSGGGAARRSSALGSAFGGSRGASTGRGSAAFGVSLGAASAGRRSSTLGASCAGRRGSSAAGGFSSA